MKVFLAGATGVIGRRLVPQLLEAGHEVTGMTRTPERAAALEAQGVRAAVADALDAEAVRGAVASAAPEAVIHQLTALPARINPRKIERDFVLNDRLRAEGTHLLLDAARAAGARRVVAQSIAFCYAPGPPGTVHREGDRLLDDDDVPKSFRRTAAAVRELERGVLEAGGVVLRYGYFYGPGSAVSGRGSMGEDVRRRRLPLVGAGAGVWSFIHVDDAAAATVAALAQGASGAYNIVDDDPAAVADWLPAFAAALGAPRPRRVPTSLARLFAGSYGVRVMTSSQGASNGLARRELGWTPRHASWRDGFAGALG